MQGAFYEQKRQVWRERVEEWRTSGLTGAEWCRQQNLAEHLLYYWKARSGLEEEGFVEIGESEPSGLRIEIGDVVVRLDPEFDSQTLRRVIEVLGDARAC